MLAFVLFLLQLHSALAARRMQSSGMIIHDDVRGATDDVRRGGGWTRPTKQSWGSMASMDKSYEAALLAAVSYGGNNLTGWTILDTVNRSAKEAATVYRHDNEPVCALVFAGTEDRQDVYHDIKSFPRSKSWCGFEGVHDGFATALEHFVASGGDRLGSLLRDHSQCGTVVAVGHSLGGAMAGLFAACANSNAKGAWISGNATQSEEEINLGAEELLRGVTISELYTFAAPLAATSILDNQKGGESRCFKGTRIFIKGNYTRDVVPELPREVNSDYLHPRLDAIWYGATNRALQSIFPCTQNETLSEPKSDTSLTVKLGAAAALVVGSQLQNYSGYVAGATAAAASVISFPKLCRYISLHKMSAYIDRVGRSADEGALSEGVFVKEGWLEKRSKWMKIRRSRWIVLSSRFLYSFEHEDRHEDPTEIFSLHDATVSKGSTDADITVTVPVAKCTHSARRLRLIAPNASIASAWIDAIQDQVRIAW